MQHSYRGSIEQWLGAGVLAIQTWKRVVNIPLFHRTRLISPSESLDSMVPLPWCLNDGAGQPSRLHHCPAELAHVRREAAGKRLRQRSGDESCWQVLHAPSTLFCKGNIGVNGVRLPDVGTWREGAGGRDSTICRSACSKWMDKIHVQLFNRFLWKCNRLYTFMNSST